jgi:hypothetical protein
MVIFGNVIAFKIKNEVKNSIALKGKLRIAEGTQIKQHLMRMA